MRGLVFEGDGVEGEDARFSADGGLHAFAEGGFVGFDLGGIDFELGEANEGWCWVRLRGEADRCNGARCEHG